jgi:aryl-alcohol dehydrogenase-like predicted oxidoreductase
VTSAETREIAPGYTISRILKGGWQLAGDHGPVDPAEAIAGMAAFVDAGITSFDCADIYTGVEEMIGAFLAQYRRDRGAEAARRVRVHTKFVPDLERLATIDRDYVTGIIDRSLQRLGVERLDLVQFHWWDYGIPNYVETAQWLDDLRQAGKIELIGGTNFDTVRLCEILDAGVPVRTMQVQYSLLDTRPAQRMAKLAAANGIAFLCYGTLAGGFLSERWLGQPDPGMSMTNRSLIKYKLVIDDIGGWDRFQALLAVLKQIADRHGTTISAVAVRAVLDRPEVAGAIVGARTAAHLPQTLAAFGLAIDAVDRTELDAVLSRLAPLEGDVYALERDRNGRHGRIMKYNLNEDAA